MLSDFWSSLIQALQDIWNAITGFFVAVFLTAFDMLKDFLFWIFETVLNFAISVLDTIGTSLNVFNPQPYINALPSDLLNIMGLIGLAEAMTIVITAILIRLLLQLIPFVRFGS